MYILIIQKTYRAQLGVYLQIALLEEGNLGLRNIRKVIPIKLIGLQT